MFFSDIINKTKNSRIIIGTNHFKIYSLQIGVYIEFVLHHFLLQSF